MSRILVIDYDPSSVHITSQLLRSAGHEVVEAVPSQSCLALVEFHQPQLVLLGIRPGDVPESRIIRELRDGAAGVDPFIVCISSSRAGAEDHVDRPEGADGFITRPVSDPEFVSRIEGFLQLRKSQDALRRSESRFRRVIEQNADGVVIVSRHGRVLMANEAAARIFARERRELEGDSFGFPLASGDCTEVEIPGAGGHYTVMEMRVVAIEWEEEEAWLASLRDVTERYEARRALEASHRALAMAVRSDLAPGYPQAPDTHRASPDGSELGEALRGNRMVLRYQPRVTIGKGVVGCEALVRWAHPERGLVAPAEFLPLAEETGLIGDLGREVLRAACEQLARWSGNAALKDLIVSVNISAQEFLHPGFVEEVGKVLQSTGAAPSHLCLELGETLLLDDMDQVSRRISDLREAGIRVAIHDIGCGVSSLARLVHLPLDELKIDRSFVRNLPGSAGDAAMTRALVRLGGDLDLEVVAEGVETGEQLAFLMENSCTTFQGFHFSKPITADELEIYVARGDATID